MEEYGPFSPEKAYLTFRDNMDTSRRLMAEIKEGQAAGESDRVLLLKAVDALGRLTDNTILLPVIRRHLEARDNPES